MSVHEKISYLSEEDKSRLYEVSNRLLSMVEIPPESFGFRLRRVANNFYTFASIVGLAIGIWIAKGHIDNINDDSLAVFNHSSQNQTIECTKMLLNGYLSTGCLSSYNSDFRVERYAAILYPTPTSKPTFTVAPTPGVVPLIANPPGS